MNRLSDEMYEGYGDASAFFILIVIFAIYLLAHVIADWLSLTLKASLRMWAAVSFSPLVAILIFGKGSLLSAAGLGIFLFCSFIWWVGKETFEVREGQRIKEDSIRKEIENEH